MLRRLLPLFALLFAASATAQPERVAERWGALLPRIVTDDGLVRYDLLQGPLRDDLAAAIESVERADPAALRTDAEKLAFWMNAYNAALVGRVLEAGVPDDIERHGFDFFFRTPVRVAGRDVTLDEIEHVILRKQPGRPALEALAVERLDPRLHVGLNCGAVSCPRLRAVAFTPETVGREMERAMRDFVGSERHFRREGGTWVVSSLLDWFGADFDAGGAPAGDYLLRYLDPARPDAAALRALLEGRTAGEIARVPDVRFEYLWRLNRAR